VKTLGGLVSGNDLKPFRDDFGGDRSATLLSKPSNGLASGTDDCQ
jgi:hypothetical protein